MEIFCTQLGEYYYTFDQNNKVQKNEVFDYSKYDLVKKKYYNNQSNSKGIRALYFFVNGYYKEDQLFERYDLTSSVLNTIRNIQRYHNCSIEDYTCIPELLLQEFAPYYLKLIQNLHQDYGKFFNSVDEEALKIFDKTTIALKRLSFRNPLLLFNKLPQAHKKYIYKIGRFSFLRVNYSNENSANGLIMSYDRSLSNIAHDDPIREAISSRFGSKGNILSLDYNAFHPRIVYALAGYNVNYTNDFYTELLNELDINIDRETIKIEIFKIIYGNMNPDSFISKNYSKIVDFDNKVHQELKNFGFIKTLTGRRRYFLDEENIETKILNSYIQMMHTDIIGEQLCKLDDFLLDKKSKLIGLISDNFIIDVFNEEEEIIKEFCKNNLQSSRYLPNCFLKLNFSEGKSWAQITPIKI